MTNRTFSSRPPRPAAMTTLTGWGGNLRTPCFYTEAETAAEVKARLDPAGTLARGLGGSYGDAALNSGRQVIGLAKLDRYLGFDEQTGTLRCEAGVSLARIIHDFAPRGWFPMITPGTKFVTVGGCVANDVHGKAHHAQGAFSSSVETLTIMLASGELVVASRSERPDLFWGTFGGMGLLGIVVNATLRLRKIETTYFRQQAIRVESLEAMLAALDEHYQKFFYPLDAIRHSNRAYGRRGFTQYQFVIPFADGRAHLRRILETIMSSGELPYLNVLKRLGKESEGLLSFPREGYTLAIDFPIRKRTVELAHRLDALVLESGGRVYLGKDSYLEAATFRAMYPRVPEWLELKAKYDPDNMFVSDLARRVGLTLSRQRDLSEERSLELSPVPSATL